MPVLKVSELSIEFKAEGVWLPAVTELSFTLERGRILALVGESGCGKSVSCMALARLLPEPPARISSGSVLLEGSDGKPLDVLKLSPKELRKIRGGRIAYVFQEPSASLNPVFRVGEQIAEAVELHRPEISDSWAEAVELLRQVGIPEPALRAKRYPHELSGGMQQRVMIAMALASRPAVLVADEPTTALDVTIQAQILDLMAKLREESGMAIILVTHNLGIVAELADDVAVMYAGRIVEMAAVDALIRSPAHPYAQALLNAVPKLGAPGGRLQTIPGSVPLPAKFPKGCRFYGRCALAESLDASSRNRCAELTPELSEFAPGRRCACHWRAQAAQPALAGGQEK
jgi:oligopeptide/dipeptide ABC transporter ATP-binding protein